MMKAELEAVLEEFYDIYLSGPNTRSGEEVVSMKSKSSTQYQDQKDPAKGKGGKSGNKGLAAMRAAKGKSGKK